MRFKFKNPLILDKPFYSFAIIAVVIIFTSCNKQDSKEDTQNEQTALNKNTEANASLEKQEAILRGEYLTTISACNDCHTPKIFTEEGTEMDTTRILAGHPEGAELPPIDVRALNPDYWVLFNSHFTAAVGPWGISYAGNLTPHKTGIKAWTEENFIQAFRTGKHMGIQNARPILPPMPWFNFKDAKEEDLKAMFAYLNSLPPIDNKVPPPVSPEDVRKMAK